MSVQAAGGPWRELFGSGLLPRFVLLCLGVWLHAADTLVTATVVPAMVEDIGGIAYVGWTIALYQIGAVVAGAATPMLCERFGVRQVLGVGALLYGGGCVLAALAPDMAVLLSARSIQGIGGGILIALSYVAIQQSFGEHLWGRLFGIVAVIWGAGSLLGPLIGGVFADLGIWRWAFWSFAIQSAVLWAMGRAWLPPGAPTAGRVTGWPVLAMTLLSLATVLIAEAGVVGRTDMALALSLAGLVLLYLAARRDRRGGGALLPVRTLEIRRPLGAGLFMVFALSIGTTGFWAYGPLLLKIMFGTDPLISGYILAGEALAWSVATMAISAAPLSAERLLIRLGAACVVLGAAGFAVVVPAGSFLGMVVCGILQGLGFGLSWPAIVQRLVRSAEPGEGAVAAASAGTVQRIGYGIGAAVAGIAANICGLADGITVPAAREAGLWVFAGFVPILAAGLLAAWRFTAGRRWTAAPAND